MGSIPKCKAAAAANIVLATVNCPGTGQCIINVGYAVDTLHFTPQGVNVCLLFSRCTASDKTAIRGQIHKRFRIGIIRQDDAHGAQGERTGFGRQIAIHGAVELHMLRGEIGEDTHVDVQSVRFMEIQRVGGSLQYQHLRALIPHHRRRTVQVFRIGHGHGGRHVGDLAASAYIDLLLPAQAAHRADQPGLIPGGGKNSAQNVGGGRLSVGSRNSDHPHIFGGIAVVVVPDQRRRHTGVFHQHVGQIHGRTGRIVNDGNGCAPLFGLGNKPVSVRAYTAQTKEHTSPTDPTGIGYNGRDFHSGIRVAILYSHT